MDMDAMCYARTSRNRADRLIPCVQLTYAVTSTSPWRGLSALVTAGTAVH